MHDHHVQGHRGRRRQPVDNHPQAVAYQQEIDMRIEHFRHRRSVGGQADNLLAALARDNIRYRDPAGRCVFRHANTPCRYWWQIAA